MAAGAAVCTVYMYTVARRCRVRTPRGSGKTRTEPQPANRQRNGEVAPRRAGEVSRADETWTGTQAHTSRGRNNELSRVTRCTVFPTATLRDDASIMFLSRMHSRAGTHTEGARDASRDDVGASHSWSRSQSEISVPDGIIFVVTMYDFYMELRSY